MSTSAIIFGVLTCGLLWGGFGYCLSIAMRKKQ